MNRYRIPNNRFCVNCLSKKTYVSKIGHVQWYSHNDDWYCSRCYLRLFRNPKMRKIYNPIYNPRQLCYKGKYIRLKENPRKGVCQWCGKRIGDHFTDSLGNDAVVKITHLHHIQYHDDDVLKDTVELCVSCHLKYSWRTGVFKNMLIKRNNNF